MPTILKTDLPLRISTQSDGETIEFSGWRIRENLDGTQPKARIPLAGFSISGTASNKALFSIEQSQTHLKEDSGQDLKPLSAKLGGSTRPKRR